MTNQIKNFLPYGRQQLTPDDIEAVCNVLRSQFITQGPAVPLFEKSVRDKLNVNYSIAVNSATSALHIACLALDLGPGDSLWTSPTTFVASANCGLYCGADVDFVDIDFSTGLMSIEKLEQKLEIAKKKARLPKVLVPVHLAGISCDMEQIFKLSKKYGFFIVEDASHAIGGKSYTNFIGDCHYSDITVFSFHPVKIITSGEGGMATTNNSELAHRMQLLRSHGITKETSRFIHKQVSPWSYEQQMLGFNYRMSDIHAALGCSQLSRLDDIIQERTRQFNFYTELFHDTPVQTILIPEYAEPSFHLAIVFLDVSQERHEEIFTQLRNLNIGVQLHYSPVHLQPYFTNLGFSKGDFPNSELYAKRAISIPLFPGLTRESQCLVAKTLLEIVSNV